MRSRSLALAATLLLAPALEAQRVLGPSQDATTLQRGVLRTSITGENILLRGRWNDGASEPLGAGLSQPLDASLLGSMRGVASALEELGVSDVNPSLGRTQADLRQRLAVTRLGLEYGVTDRLMLRVQAPFVRARAEAQMGVAFGSATMGPNPIAFGSGVAARNRIVVDAYTGAAAALTARRDACVANAAAHPECGSILSEAAQVDAAIARATRFANTLAELYGAQGLSAGSAYVPAQGEPVEQAFAQVGNALRNDFSRWGVTNVTATTGLPLGAQTPITADQLTGILTGPGPDGLQAKATGKSARQNLGDVDIGLTYQLFDRIRAGGNSAADDSASRGLALSQSLALTYRVGGGAFDLPDDLIDLGTGSGHDALALHVITDLLFSRDLWATVTFGWARAATHLREVRLPSVGGNDLIGAASLTAVEIVPADLFELRVAPRYVLNDYIGVGGEWRYRARGADRVTPLVVAGEPVPFVATLPYGDGAMQTPSDSDEQRWAWTVSYSTLDSKRRGVARAPIEIFYTHEQSIGSSRGIVPRRWEDRVQIRVYTRLFGR